jgi:hypothetical protein
MEREDVNVFRRSATTRTFGSIFQSKAAHSGGLGARLYLI